jgi:hypothetical protein
MKIAIAIRIATRFRQQMSPLDTGKGKRKRRTLGEKNLDANNRASAMRRFKFDVFSVRVTRVFSFPFLGGIFPRERHLLSILDTEYSSELCWRTIRDVIPEELYRTRRSRFLEQE